MGMCIYCPNEADSREHWVPRGLGVFRGYTPLLDRLCEACNRRLGQQLDQELMRTGPTGFHRALLGVEGRHGPPKVSPFQYRAMQADQPTKMMMPALGREHKVLAEAYTDNEDRPSARPIRQVVLRMPDGRMECVPFPRGWKAEQLKNAVTNRGLEDGTPAEIYVEDNEDPRNADSPEMIKVRTLLTEVFGKGFSAQAYGGSGERTQNRLALVAGLNTLYMRAVAKVAFHYFLWACPVLRGNEPTFGPFRAFISEGVGNWREFVQYDAPQFLPVLREGNVPIRTSHFFCAALTREEATAFVQFFVGPHLPSPSRVRLAIHPLAIEGKDFACHQASYFDDEADKADGHDGELIAIDVWERKIITPR